MKGTIQLNGSLAGLAVQTVINRSATGGVGQEHTLAAAKSGTLSTRTNDTDGTLTLEAGHGITDGQILSIFWTDPTSGDPKFCYDATVGVVAGESVPFTGAAGTALPAQGSAIVADVEEELDADFDGDKLEMLLAAGNKIVGFQFVDSGDNVLDAAIRRANEPYDYVKGIDASNPLTGNPVDAVRVANGDSTAALTFKLAALYNSDA